MRKTKLVPLNDPTRMAQRRAEERVLAAVHRATSGALAHRVTLVHDTDAGALAVIEGPGNRLGVFWCEVVDDEADEVQQLRMSDAAIRLIAEAAGRALALGNSTPQAQTLA